MTPQTLLAIGSNSKSFTVVLMSQLVDEGKLDWDAPVQEYLPDFRLHDDYAAKNMRVKDLVTHVSGLPRHDVLWYGRSWDREEIFSRLRYLEPTTTFRGRYQYQNLMFMTAGVARGTRHRAVVGRPDPGEDLPTTPNGPLEYVGAGHARGGRLLPSLLVVRRRAPAGPLQEHRQRRARWVHQLERRGDAPLRPDAHRRWSMGGGSGSCRRRTRT